jgi:hypothetical protein
MPIYQVSYRAKPAYPFSQICLSGVWPGWVHISYTTKRKLTSAVVGATGAERYWLSLPVRPAGERYTLEDVRQLVRQFESDEAPSESR